MPFKNTFNRYLAIDSDSIEDPGSDHPGANVDTDQSTPSNLVYEPGNGYRYVVFISPGTITFNRGGNVDVLCIGGGGSGGTGATQYNPDPNPPWNPNYYHKAGGGGGAGGMVELFNEPFPDGQFDISVGSGGDAVGPTGTSAGNYGSPSYIQKSSSNSNSFTTITAYGGGRGGGSPGSNQLFRGGGNGGSGGGGGQGTSISAYDPFGNNTTNEVSSNPSPAPLRSTQPEPQGNNGGRGAGDSYMSTGSTTQYGGGGGGAGAAANISVGGNGRTVWSGDSGVPTDYGTPGPTPGRWFCGGGAGGRAGQVQSGGAGGGGPTGFSDSFPPISAPNAPSMPKERANGGGGAGQTGNQSYAGSSNSDSHGSNGIIIFRYQI